MKNKFFIGIVMLFFSVNLHSQEKTTLDEIIENNIGKVIYIDFWASWCKPCRKEMKLIPKINEMYKNKEVVFIYLSIEMDETSWEKACEKEKIIGEKYNLMTLKMKKSANFQISQNYNFSVNSIPRYFIFNKKGRLVNDNAPRPSEKEKLYGELDKYLIE